MSDSYHHPSANLSVSLNDGSIGDCGQTPIVPELALPPTHDIEIAPWLEPERSEPQEPPFPPPKNGPSLPNGSMSNYYYSNGPRSSANLSVSTNYSLQLNDSVDDYGKAFMVPKLDLPSTQDVEIAPWLDSSPEPPLPPPKNRRSFVFPPKASSSLQPGSSSSLFSRQPRGSESHSNLNIGDSVIASTPASMVHEPLNRSFSPLPELRKTKSPMFSSLRKMVPKRNLRSGSNAVTFLPIPSPPQTPRFKRQRKKSSGPDDVQPFPTIEPPDSGAQEIYLDINLNEMEGIVNSTVLSNSGYNASSSTSSLGSTSGITSSQSDSDSSQFGGALLKSNNSFPPSGAVYKSHKPSRKVSPNTIVPLEGWTAPEGWTVPESWSAVMKDGKDPAGEAESSSDESTGGNVFSLSRATQQKIRIRIYKADNTYLVLSMSTNVTVAELTPKLDQKLPVGEEREMHQLYLKERGRERILAQKDRPADIVRRRLEQAGYDETDGQDIVGDAGLSFLLKFVYKSVFLGPTEEELKFDNFEYIDLTGRSLRTIPVALHQHADSIVSLRLSRNPMIEIPLDFIQSCTTLRELRLCHMAMKKVPHSLRHSTTLTRLDLSCNRIVTLDEAYLDDIPGLTTLHVQNNRLEKLPWRFPRLRQLITLNISNNKFRTFPAGVSRLGTLRDLDISFNMISELPEEIGQLQNLERLVMVGNQVSRLPDGFSSLARLEELDCRRNQISDLTIACMLPKIETVSAVHNALHGLALSMGPCLTTLDASHNEITQLTLVREPVGWSPVALTSLDISNAKLSVLSDYTLLQLTSLRRLKLDNTYLQVIPESLGDLNRLEMLSCANNSLGALPQSIGRLQRLETLDVHNNSLTELPISLWNCASLSRLNATSNLLVLWHDPPLAIPEEDMSSFADTPVVVGVLTFLNNRKPSTSTITDIPPLAHSLQLLYLGENSFTYEGLHPLMILKELRVLNLSFNNIQDMPSNFFRHLTKLEEVYLSGNGLINLPSQDLPKLTRLSTLFLNRNRLQTLPQELGKVKSLTVLDVGSNLLKYNINNWEFDWNWNFNKSLRYLNLSGNKRLQIKSDASTPGQRQSMSTVSRHSLAGFSELTQLRVLGLMDVTITTTGTNTGDIPDENDDRRVRTSSLIVNGMSYGIADTLGKNEHLNMLDLVHEFRGMKKDAVFAMFGRAQPPKQLPAATTSNRLAKYLQENFVRVFLSQINSLDREHGENVPDALRRSFLKLNQDLHDTLFSSTRKMSQTSGAIPANIDLSNLRSGASGIVVYILDKKMYVANVGNVLAVVSRGGSAVSVSRKHDPYDRAETARIRATEGWISPPGLVKDEIDISRSFGFFHLIPTVNARPDIFTYDLTELDEFVIIANRGLWDYVSYQTAVDIAQRTEPMVAAQKLRDFAISYGADGSIMTMVIGVADLFKGVPAPDKRKKRGIGIMDRTLDRLKEEVPPPVGHVAIVLTSIKGLMHLRDVNPALPTAMHLHNTLLRRFLRICGGYEVKTEDDSFMCSFPTALAAVWWCMTVQVELLDVPWPLEILECADGKAIYDEEERLIARGLSVRMGIHCGTPICERDRVTNRMDYFGPIVNQTSRIEGSATGGHIMCSSNVIREINAKIFETEPETEYSDAQPQEAIDAIRRLDPIVVPVGEVRLEGLEVPELLSLVFPSKLIGRKELDDTFGVVQMRELAMLCLRLEMSAFGHVPYPEWNGNRQGPAEVSSRFQPPLMTDKMTDADLMSVLHSLTERIENVEISLRAMAGVKKDQGPNADSVPEAKQVLVAALMSHLHPQPQSPLAASAKSLPRNKSLYSPKSLCIRLAPAFLLLSWVPPETLGSSALDQFTVESFENYITQSIIPNLESREFWAASNLKNWLYARGEDHYNMICGEHFLTHVLRRVQSMHIVLPPMLLSKNSLTDIYCLLLQCPDACPIHSGALRFLDFLDQYHADLEALVTLLKCKWWTKIHPDARRSLSAKVCKYMAHDISVMVAELVLCLQDREFLGSPGARAQNFLDLLQDVLDLDIFSAVKPLITKALLHLCSASGLYPRCFTLTSLEKVGEQVAAGGFSDIWKGLIRTQTVCVKVMRLFQTADIEALLKEFGREALIWRQLCHPNLLPFLGIYYLDKRLCLVSPWMETGNVMEFLKNEPPNTIHRLSLILDVALGLDHLRTQNVVHGDLKAINILVTPSRRACIADFGLAHIASTMTLRFTHSTSNVRGGTTRYLAPELFKPSPSHFGSDVYAFASTCYEIMTGKVTFHELPNDGAVMFAILRGEHPSRPQPWSGTPALDGLWDLLQTCWYSQPEERPSARQIVQRLEELSISATAASSTTDWDEKFTSKFRRGLRDKPLVPLATQLEEMLFGGGEV